MGFEALSDDLVLRSRYAPAVAELDVRRRGGRGGGAATAAAARAVAAATRHPVSAGPPPARSPTAI